MTTVNQNTDESTSSTASLKPFYTLSWKDWDDNDGQKALNLEDFSKISPQHFFVGGNDASGHDLFIARQPTQIATTPLPFSESSGVVLSAAGEYHPSDNTFCGRMIDAGKLDVVTKGFQVLKAASISLDHQNYNDAVSLEWTNWTSGQSISPADNFFQVGVSDQGNALYACRATIDSKSGQAIGLFNSKDSTASIPFKKETSTPSSFQLLKVTAATLQQVRQRMVINAYAAYATYQGSDKLSAAQLQNVALFGGVPLDVTGLKDSGAQPMTQFDLSPLNVSTIALPATQDNTATNAPGNFLNVALAGEESNGNLVISFRGTLSSFGSDWNKPTQTSTNAPGNTTTAATGSTPASESSLLGGTYYDWANNFIANQTDITGLGKVHLGFYYATMSVMGQTSGGNPGLYQWVLDKVKSNQELSISVVGHSKGGAMAHIAALLLQNELKAKGYDKVQINVSTFGAPKAGGVDFVANYNVALPNSYSYIYNADFVPWLPIDNEMAAFVKYNSDTLDFVDILTALWNYSMKQLSTNATSHPTLQSTGADFLGALKSMTTRDNLVAMLFGTVTGIIPVVKDYAISEDDVNTVAQYVSFANADALLNISTQSPEVAIQAVYQHLFSALGGNINVNGTSLSLEELWTDLSENGKNPGFILLIILTLAVAISSRMINDVIGELKGLTCYEANGTDNYSMFVDQIASPTVEIFDKLIEIGISTPEAMAEFGTSLVFDYRYGRVGNTKYLYHNRTSDLCTADGITPGMFFSSLLAELNVDNVVSNKMTVNPVSDHSAYKGLF